MFKVIRKIILGPFFWPILFLAGLQRTVDPDLGWNIRVGEWIMHHGQIPKVDLFSFWAQGHPYVYHSWLAQVLIFFLESNFGLWGLTFFFAAILLFSLFFLEKLASILGIDKFWVRVLILLATPTFFASIFTRPHMFSFLFTNLLLFCLFKFNRRPLYLFLFLPPIFILWANFHGGFVVGLVVLLTIFLTQRKLVFACLSILGFLSTLATPFGWESFKQLISMLGNPLYGTFSSVSEWTPLLTRGLQHQIFAAVVLGILILPLIFQSIRINWILWGLAVVLFLLTLKVSRLNLYLLAPLILLGGQMLSVLEKQLIQKLAATWGMLEKFSLKIAIGLLVFSVFLRMGRNINFVWQTNQNERAWSEGLTSAGMTFPHEAIKFLRDKPPLPRLFNLLGWGGYFVWRLPDQSVFIVGGMDSYKVDGRFLLEDYFNLEQAKNYQELLSRYEIQSVFLPSMVPLAQILDKSSDWKKVYQDEMATILVKRL